MGTKWCRLLAGPDRKRRRGPRLGLLGQRGIGTATRRFKHRPLLLLLALRHSQSRWHSVLGLLWRRRHRHLLPLLLPRKRRAKVHWSLSQLLLSLLLLLFLRVLLLWTLQLAHGLWRVQICRSHRSCPELLRRATDLPLLVLGAERCGHCAGMALHLKHSLRANESVSSAGWMLLLLLLLPWLPRRGKLRRPWEWEAFFGAGALGPPQASALHRPCSAAANPPMAL